jgi:hypothetical protein
MQKRLPYASLAAETLKFLRAERTATVGEYTLATQQYCAAHFRALHRSSNGLSATIV